MVGKHLCRLPIKITLTPNSLIERQISSVRENGLPLTHITTPRHTLYSSLRPVTATPSTGEPLIGMSFKGQQQQQQRISSAPNTTLIHPTPQTQLKHTPHTPLIPKEASRRFTQD